jgi:fumarylacetoacetase-like protein
MLMGVNSPAARFAATSRRKNTETRLEHHMPYPGDVIVTGTPAGVGPAMIGDVLDANVEGVGSMIVRVAGQGAA